MCFFYSLGHASDKTNYRGPYDCLKSIYKQHGIRGWYKGLVPMAWRYVVIFLIWAAGTIAEYMVDKSIVYPRDVPSYGVYIIAYEWIFQYIEKPHDQLPTPFQTIWVGGTAGWCTEFVYIF